MTDAPMRNRRPDATDERILGLLMQDARASFTKLGAAVNLSANAVAQRVRRLEEDGAIRGYHAALAPGLYEGGIFAVLWVGVAIDADSAVVEGGLAALPAVEEILDLAGSVDYEVRLRCADQDHLYEVVQVVRAVPGVTSTRTLPVLRQVLRRR